MWSSSPNADWRKICSLNKKCCSTATIAPSPEESRGAWKEQKCQGLGYEENLSGSINIPYLHWLSLERKEPKKKVIYTFLWWPQHRNLSNLLWKVIYSFDTASPQFSEGVKDMATKMLLLGPIMETPWGLELTLNCSVNPNIWQSICHWELLSLQQFLLYENVIWYSWIDLLSQFST